MCFNSGGGSSASSNTTTSTQLQDNSTGAVNGSKTAINLIGSDSNTISYTNLSTDQGAIAAGEKLGLSAIESGSKALDTTAKTFSEFAGLLTNSTEKSISAVQMASASQSQQANNTFKDLTKILVIGVVVAIGFFSFKK